MFSFGVVSGTVLGAKIDPRPCQPLMGSDLVFDLAICWFQDGRQDRPKRAQEPPRAGQDPPRPSQEDPKPPKSGPRPPQDRLKTAQEPPRAASETLTLSLGVVLEFDSLIQPSLRFSDATDRFVSFINSLSTPQVRPAECAKRSAARPEGVEQGVLDRMHKSQKSWCHNLP